jgi:type I restriction enzyme S subunit
MENWETTTLGEVCRRGGGNIQTGPFGSQLHASDYVSVGIPSIMPVNIGENRISIEGIARITVEEAERLEKYRVREGDIVYSRRGDVERRALIRAQEDGWLCGTGCLRIRLGEGVVDPLFASYYLGDSEVRKWIVRHAVGATMPNLNTSILSALPFVVPPIEEQKAIAKILSSLDDKIELNRRMNETLEVIARALFKAWFVDFEPVRANMENRPSDSASPEIAKLFPSEFENGIPKGWEVKKLGEVLEAKGGTTPSTKNPTFWDGENYWATPKDLSNLQFPVLLSTERKITDEGVRQISSGVLPKGTLLLSSRAPIGYLSISQIPVSINQGFIAIQPKKVSNLFMLYWLMQNMETVKSKANGSTFQEISKSSFREVQITVASSDILNSFEKRVKPLFEKIVSNEKEKTKLEEIRDSLLPRLISGKLPVRKIEDKAKGENE